MTPLLLALLAPLGAEEEAERELLAREVAVEITVPRPSLPRDRGGLRMGSGVAADSLTLRPVLLRDADDTFLASAMAMLRHDWGRWSIDLEVPAVFASHAEQGWSEAGLGRLRTGGCFHFGEAGHELGLFSGFGLREEGEGLRSWGSIGRETLPGIDLGVYWQRSWLPRAPLSLRLAGFVTDMEGFSSEEPFTGVEVVVAKVFPLDHLHALVLEHEYLVDPTPSTFRAALRREQPLDVGSLTLDVGTQIPLAPFLDGQGAWPQLFLQARWFRDDPEG